MEYYVWCIALGVGIPALWLLALIMSAIVMRNIAARTRLVMSPPPPARQDLSYKQRANWDKLYRTWWIRDRIAHGEGARMFFGENPN
jgi:hypothetical protein